MAISHAPSGSYHRGSAVLFTSLSTPTAHEGERNSLTPALTWTPVLRSSCCPGSCRCHSLPPVMQSRPASAQHLKRSLLKGISPVPSSHISNRELQPQAGTEADSDSVLFLIYPCPPSFQGLSSTSSRNSPERQCTHSSQYEQGTLTTTSLYSGHLTLFCTGTLWWSGEALDNSERHLF